MAARITLAARLSTLEASVATLVDALTAAQAAQAPAKVAPAKGKVQSPSAAFGGLTFDAYVEKRVATRKPCAIAAHGESCNRTFGSGSSGDTNHEPKIV